MHDVEIDEEEAKQVVAVVLLMDGYVIFVAKVALLLDENASCFAQGDPKVPTHYSYLCYSKFMLSNIFLSCSRRKFMIYIPVYELINVSNVADESPYTLEERMVTSALVHERLNTGNSLDKISRKFRERFKKNSPTRKTMWNWERKLFKTGNMKNASRSGR